MKRIAAVEIENFQSHQRSSLEFGPGLNVILGPSDNGKSAVLRALRWALYNEPRGSEFVRAGARECRVTVTMDDGVAITRELLLTKSGGAARNRYVVTTPGAEPQVFEGFGSDVPLEVTRAHGMPQVLLDTDKRVGLSFGSQLEGPFLMTESGSFRARAIGRLLGVHVVDAAVRDTQRDLKSAKAEAGRLAHDLQQYEAELIQYTDIPEQEARLERADGLIAQVDLLQNRAQQLESIRAQLDRTDLESLAMGRQLALLSGVDSAGSLVSRAVEVYRSCSRLERLDEELKRVTVETQQARVRVDALRALPVAQERTQEAAIRQTRLDTLSQIHRDLSQRDAELNQAEHRVSQLTQVPLAQAAIGQVQLRLERLERLQERAKQWSDVTQRLHRGAELLDQTETELASSLAEYEQVLLRLERCPTCMQSVEPSAVRRILAEMGGHVHRHD